MATSAKTRTALATVEAGYTLQGEVEDWLDRVMSAASPSLDVGMGLLGWTFRVDETGNHTQTSPLLAQGGVAEDLRSRLLDGSEEASRRVALLERALRRGGPRLASASAVAERASGRPAGVSEHLGDLRPWGVADVLGAYVRDASGCGVVLAAPAPDRQRVSTARASRWSRVLVHLASAHRLHRALQDDLDAGAAELVLDEDGAVRHAEADAAEHLEALRRAARCVDLARGGERDPATALSAWRGLVEGRWSLLDRFERDGRRYLVARRNEPDAAAVPGLTLRERQVAAYAAWGYSNKQVAYALGIAASTVSSHLRAAMRKLGARDRRDLAAVFSATTRPL